MKKKSRKVGKVETSSKVSTSTVEIDALETLPTEDQLLKWIMLLNDIAWRNRFKREDIEKWLSNFTGDVHNIGYERRLALWLLANFVYYNETEVRHLCKTLFSDFIHYMLSEVSSEDGYKLSLDRIIDETIFLSLGLPGESGCYVLYYFRQENKLEKDIMSYPNVIPHHVKNIVYVDDVTISGSQAKDYIHNNSKFFKGNEKIYLLTFLSTKEAIELLESINVHVISCINLDERDKCFSQKSNLFYKNKSTFYDCKKFAVYYGEKSLSASNPVRTPPLGYKNGEYVFGFFYNIPDNTLPIFWADNKGWKPLIKRYEKLVRWEYNERFI